MIAVDLGQESVVANGIAVFTVHWILPRHEGFWAWHTC